MESNKIIEREIMQSRHMFIYGKDGQERRDLLKSLEKKYPAKLDSETPVAIYLEEFGLPKEPTYKVADPDRLSTIAYEYLDFSLAHNVVRNAQENIPLEELNRRIQTLLENMNHFTSNLNLKSIQDLEQLLRETRDFYKKYFISYSTQGKEMSIDKLKLPFLMFDLWVQQYKTALNSDSYFALMVDKQEPMSILSTKCINQYVGSRCNRDISMKVATSPDGWDSYVDRNGQFIEAIHDYGVVEIDDSYNQYIRRKMDERNPYI